MTGVGRVMRNLGSERIYQDRAAGKPSPAGTLGAIIGTAIEQEGLKQSQVEANQESYRTPEGTYQNPETCDGSGEIFKYKGNYARIGNDGQTACIGGKPVGKIF